MSSNLIVRFDCIAEVLIHTSSRDSYEIMEIIVGKRCDAVDFFLFFVGHVLCDGSNLVDGRIIKRDGIEPKGRILCYACCR